MTEEERIELISQAKPKRDISKEIDDLAFLYKEPLTIQIEKRLYSVSPLKVRDVQLLVNLQDYLISVDRTVEWFSKILNEPDKDFLLENLTSETITDILKKIEVLNQTPPSSVQSDSDTPFGVGFRWNIFILMRDLHLSFDDVSNLTLSQLVILRQCIREVDDTRSLEEAKFKAQQQLAARSITLGR